MAGRARSFAGTALLLLLAACAAPFVVPPPPPPPPPATVQGLHLVLAVNEHPQARRRALNGLAAVVQLQLRQSHAAWRDLHNDGARLSFRLAQPRRAAAIRAAMTQFLGPPDALRYTLSQPQPGLFVFDFAGTYPATLEEELRQADFTLADMRARSLFAGATSTRHGDRIEIDFPGFEDSAAAVWPSRHRRF